MSQLLVGRANEQHIEWPMLHGMFRLRDEVFHKRLGWDVQSHQGLERDQYDELSPVYVLARGENRKIVACGRLLPTTGPYMLRDTFPELLRGEPAPEDSRVWEVSRFAVKALSGEDKEQLTLGYTSLKMIQAATDFATHNGIEAFVLVTSVAIERLLRKAGIPMRRFGDGKAVQIGKVLSVACWIHVNEAYVHVVDQNVSHYEVEVERRAA